MTIKSGQQEAWPECIIRLLKLAQVRFQFQISWTVYLCLLANSLKSVSEELPESPVSGPTLQTCDYFRMETGLMPRLRVSLNSIALFSKRKPGGLALEPTAHVLRQLSQTIMPGHCLRGKYWKKVKVWFSSHDMWFNLRQQLKSFALCSQVWTGLLAFFSPSSAVEGHKEGWWLDMWRAPQWHTANWLCCFVWMSRCAAAAVPLAYGCAVKYVVAMPTSTLATRVVTSSWPVVRKRTVQARSLWGGCKYPDQPLCPEEVNVTHCTASFTAMELSTWRAHSSCIYSQG